jgi:hypothetical protein
MRPTNPALERTLLQTNENNGSSYDDEPPVTTNADGLAVVRVDTPNSLEPFDWIIRQQLLPFLGPGGARMSHLPLETARQLIAVQLPPCKPEMEFHVR